MSASERTPLESVRALFRGTESRFKILPSAGLSRFNDFQCLESVDGVKLWKPIKDRQGYFYMEYRREDPMIAAIFRLEVSSPEQLQRLLLIEGYFEYTRTGRREFPQLGQLEVGVTTVMVSPYKGETHGIAKASINMETGALRLTSKNLYSWRSPEIHHYPPVRPGP